MLTFVIHSLALASSLPTAQHVNPATALRYLSGACGSLTGVGCNSYQQPLFNGQSFIPDLVLQATKSDVIVDPTQHRQSDCVASSSGKKPETRLKTVMPRAQTSTGGAR